MDRRPGPRAAASDIDHPQQQSGRKQQGHRTSAPTTLWRDSVANGLHNRRSTERGSPHARSVRERADPANHECDSAPYVRFLPDDAGGEQFWHVQKLWDAINVLIVIS
jgi:hypothetical protein